MEITVQIGSETRPISDVTEHWINDQLSRRHREGASVCVIVNINESGANLRLATPACGRSVGGRQANTRESAIIALWNEKNLNTNDFTGGSLVGFLAQVRKFL